MQVLIDLERHPGRVFVRLTFDNIGSGVLSMPPELWDRLWPVFHTAFPETVLVEVVEE